MKILLTGGAGYIGSAVAEALSSIEEIEKISIYDNLSAKNYGLFQSKKLQKLSFLEGDILDSRKLKKEIKSADVVFHLAGISAADSHTLEQINHWGTSEVLNAIEESDVQKLIYLSSTHVYGTGKGLNADSDISPLTDYAHSVTRAENQIKRLWDKKHCFIVRSADVFGFSSGIRYNNWLNKSIFQAQFKGRIQIEGNGRNEKSFVYINQLVAALCSLLKHNGPSEIYTLTEHNMQVLDVVEALQEVYPGLEFIFVNPHLQNPDSSVKSSENINSLAMMKPISLVDELHEFKSHFSF